MIKITADKVINEQIFYCIIILCHNYSVQMDSTKFFSCQFSNGIEVEISEW